MTANLAPDLDVGDRLLGRYAIEGLIGAGGTAEVYRAHDARLRRSVAIKVIKRGLRGNSRVVERFVREGRALATLDSPYVVPVHDVGEDGDRSFLVMKLVEAPSLDVLLDQEAPMPEGRALRILCGVLHGLADLHRHGIIHRDVKPSNVVVEPGDRVMLLDFGVALDMSDPSITAEGTVLGTPSYMAPEQLLSPADVDARTDLYAAGVTLFEMLTGHLPFTGETPAAVVHGHISNAPPDVRSIVPMLSADTARIVTRALEKNVLARFGSADEMRVQVEAALTEPHRPRRIGTIALALALLIVAVSVILFDVDEEPVIARVVPVEAPAPPPSIGVVVPPPPEEPPLRAPIRKKRKRKRPKPEPRRAPAPIRAAPQSMDPTVRRAQKLLAAGDTRAAIRLLTGLVRENPERAEPYATLGDAHARTGNKIAAIAAYRRYLALGPNGPGARRVEAALDRLGGR